MALLFVAAVLVQVTKTKQHRGVPCMGLVGYGS
jgi:hypothetical protein